MKNKFCTTFLIIFFIVLLNLIPSCFALEGDDIVTFNDQKLKEVFTQREEWQNAYDLNGDGEMSVTEMEGVYNLELDFFPTDLSPLSYATNLNNVALKNITQEDLEGIEILTNLESLILGNSDVKDISAINKLTTLKDLTIYGCENITDISCLKDLTNLTNFSLSETSVEDASVVSKFTNLVSLNLNTNKIKSVPDLSTIKYFTDSTVNYNSIYLNNNEITDISGLDGTNFFSIELSNNKLVEISGISNMTKLEVLNAGKNLIETAKDLPSTLTTVMLTNNKISNFSFLNGLTNLKYLYLSENQITDISDLENLKSSLSTLDLSSNKITDISVISKLANLQYLNVSHTEITDLDVSNLEHLYNLYCYNCKLKTVNFENNAKLANIFMQNNSISDISSLEGLEKLSVLNMSTNPISDISSLSNTTARYIYLVDTLVNPYNEATFHIMCTLEENGVQLYLGDYSQFKPSNEETFTTEEIKEVTVGEEKVTIMPMEKKTTVEEILTESSFPVIDTYTIKVLDASGNEKSSTAKIGSRNIIQVTDEKGTVLAEYTVVVSGDVNGDGETKIYDSFQILKDTLISLGKELDAIEILIRDFNNDGNVRIYDAFQFLKEALFN